MPASISMPAENEDIPSTSCSEESPLVREPPKSTRGVWKVAAAAATTALIAAAGMSWPRSGTLSEEPVSLATVEGYSTYAGIGCSNWESIEMSRKETASKAECAAECTASELCTSFNWQANACEPGHPVAKTCLLFKGNCVSELNPCWEWNWGMTAQTITVSQTMTVAATGPAEDVGEGVKATLAAEGIEPVTITKTKAGRRLQEAATVTVTWSLNTENLTLADDAFEFAENLKVDEAANKKFTAALKTNVPATVKITADTLIALAPAVTKGDDDTKRPGCASDSDNCAAKGCCEEPGLYCYEKDAYWAGCRPSCNIGIHEHDPEAFKTPWSCTVLDKDPDTPEPIPESPISTTSKVASCSETGENCVTTKCCADPSHQCYQKDPYWAGCKESCTAGVQPEDVAPWNTPWTCDLLEEEAVEPLTTS